MRIGMSITRAGKSTGHRRQSGFTLMELLIVMAIIGILASSAALVYRHSVTKAKEAALKQNLYHLRECINQYYADRSRYPASLQNLVEAGYLKDIPRNPFMDQRSQGFYESQPDSGYGGGYGSGYGGEQQHEMGWMEIPFQPQNEDEYGYGDSGYGGGYGDGYGGGGYGGGGYGGGGYGGGGYGGGGYGDGGYGGGGYGGGGYGGGYGDGGYGGGGWGDEEYGDQGPGIWDVRSAVGRQALDGSDIRDW